MSFSIEVTGEAYPLNSKLLKGVLASAVSHNPQQVQTGTQQLSQWETQPGFFSLLQTSFNDKTLPNEVRYLAIIHLKNGIDKFWRKTAKNAISKEEKAVIRSKLIDTGLDEDEPNIALQNALVIAKIARYEYPHDWPDLITSLMSTIRKMKDHPWDNCVFLPNALMILLYLMKELSTARLQRSRSSLQSVTPEVFQFLGQLYVEKVNHWQDFIAGKCTDEGSSLDDVGLSLTTIKILRRLIVAGFEAPNRNRDVAEFWTIIRGKFDEFVQIVSQQPHKLSDHVRQLVEKHLIQFSKLHLEMAQMHPAAFALLPGSVQLAASYWALVSSFGENFGSTLSSPSGRMQDETDEKSLEEKLSLKGLLILRSCVKMVFSPTQTFKYKRHEDKVEKHLSIELMKTSIFTDNFVQNIMETLITRFFVFRASDLRDWEEDPEEWEKKEDGEGESWEFSIRPCSEKLFLELVIYFKDLLTQPLLNVFRSVATPENSNLLFKDSVYNAVGLSASVLSESLDFDEFLKSTLGLEVQKREQGYRILRRRVAILIRQWISIRISRENRPIVYQIFQHLLTLGDPLNDQVVRITAGRCFKYVADEWGFTANDFMPFAPSILGSLMALIQEVSLTETKMALLDTVSVIVERLEHNVVPYAESIVALLPPLWTQSGEEHLMKQAILTILERLVKSMKGESQRYHSMVLPLIRHSVESDSNMRVYLLEDGLQLWQTILIHTPSPPSAEILGLAPLIFPVLEAGIENLRSALAIAESYILLAPAEMLDTNMRNALFGTFSTLIGTLKADANGLICRLIEISIRAAENLAGEPGTEVIGKAMLESNVLSKIIVALRDCWDCRQSTGPNRKYSSIDGIVESDYLNVLARLVLASPRVFMAVFEVLSSSRGENIDGLMDWLLNEWFNHFDNILMADKKKLHCLALTRFTETGHKWLLPHLQDLLSLWTTVIIEVREDDDDKGGDNLVFFNEGELKTQNSEAPEEERRRHITFSDPVHTINTSQFVHHQINILMAGCGGQEQFTQLWLANVDKDVLNSFVKLEVV
ncbi:MAG: hypothetical protein M1829_005151 [Trizodia sp. TS-e1964]|nr:MAG: hypothetical protein M1829_005151 [Trizodia sp. TS-e1964]